jgi:hypothetical protein
MDLGRRSWLGHPKSLAQTVRFLNDDIVVSGGFDNAIVFSSVRKGQVLARIPMPSFQSCNPPHTHCIDISKSSTRLPKIAAALGDGSIVLIDTASGTFRKNGGINIDKVRESTVRWEEIHLAAANCVRFVGSEDRLLGSTGNDMSLAISKWDDNSDGKCKLAAITKFKLDSKPNAICFPNSRPGYVVVCDTDKEIKLMPYN